MYYIEPVIDFYTKNENNTRLVELYTNKGLILAKDNRLQEAVAAYQKALSYSSETSELRQALAYLHLGEAYFAMNNLSAAHEAFKACYKLTLELNAIETLERVTQALAYFHEKSGNFKLAFQYLSENKQYADSSLQRKNAKALTDIKTRYETAQKDQQIQSLAQQNEIQQLTAERQELQLFILGVLLLLVLGGGLVIYNRSLIRSRNNRQLAAKNRELSQKNELIQSQSEEKALLLKEIHHRVKNNLQVISSLLSMQTRWEQNQQVLDAVKESQSRVKTMALLHEKLYQNNALSSINMQEYLQQLGQFLSSTYRQNRDIQIIVDAGDITLDVNTAVPVGLITNELLSNAMKYAFYEYEEGEILLTLKPNETGGYELRVQDNGKGLDQEIDFENLSSLGLKLVYTLTRQIQGKLNIKSEQGTTFAISFNDKMVAA
jgi:two-component sensor histidine kinase